VLYITWFTYQTNYSKYQGLQNLKRSLITPYSPCCLDNCGWPDDRTPRESCLAISAHHSKEERGLHHHDEATRCWGFLQRMRPDLEACSDCRAFMEFLCAPIPRKESRGATNPPPRCLFTSAHALNLFVFLYSLWYCTHNLSNKQKNIKGD